MGDDVSLRMRTNLVSIMGEDELEKKIKEKIEEFHGLLTEEGAIKLIWREVGANTTPIPISALQEGDELVCVEGRLRRVFSLTVFPTGAKRRRIEIEDESGRVIVNLWGRKAEESNKFLIGDILRLENVFFKNGRIELGYAGRIIIKERAGFISLNELSKMKDATVNIVGEVIQKDGKELVLRDGKEKLALTFPDDDWRRGAIHQGMVLRIENAIFDGERLIVGKDTRVLVKKKQNFLEGRLRDIKVVDNKLVLFIDDEEISFPYEQGYEILQFFGNRDVLLETIVKLKKKCLLNKYVRIFLNGRPVLTM